MFTSYQKAFEAVNRMLMQAGYELGDKVSIPREPSHHVDTGMKVTYQVREVKGTTAQINIRRTKVVGFPASFEVIFQGGGFVFNMALHAMSRPGPEIYKEILDDCLTDASVDV